MTTRIHRWILLAAVAVLAAHPAAAQSIRAVARDAATGAPVAEAMVRVEAADGTLAVAGFADAAGVVVLRLRQPGTYRVEATRSGYQPTSVQVEAGGAQVQAEIRMAQRPFTLDTVVVMGQLPNERERQGFERRRALGEGVFLDSAYLSQRSGRVAYAGDMLSGVPGLYMQRRAGATVPRSERGWGCMVMLLDGRPFSMSFRDGGRRELHQVIGPRDVEAVEVYREFDEVPPEFRQYADTGPVRCGVYLYWTRARW
ncbi:MAG TPA: carboxypeptidase-like regulatory domain-containing protein [Longimicrobium sp.]|nr:carboxypeptidase-like regulatory domain-containing protein [Longimicrobium sp.]